MIPRPLGVRILVKPLDDDKQPTIWTPEPTEPTKRGAVVEIGEDVKYLQAGDEVLFAHQGCVQFDYEGERYYLMPEGRVLALLDRVGATH